MPELKAFLAGGGEMADLIRERDWSATPLGEIRDWPQSLRSVLSICLRSSASTAVFWGPEFRFLYNDAWAPYLGDRHPAALGEPAQTVMADIWPALESQFRTVFDDAKAVNSVDTLLVRDRPSGHVDTYWSYSVIPVASEDGTLTYGRTFGVPSNVAERLGEFAIVQHGVDLNGNGVYDEEAAGPSDLDPSLPQEATIPANCGVIVPVSG